MTENVTEAISLSDEEVVRRVLDGDTGLYEIIMRRYNQRLYRVARSIVRDPDEAEDVMQESYFRAYAHLGQFAGEAKFSTWLTRIAIHEALARVHRQRKTMSISGITGEGQTMYELRSAEPNPEVKTSEGETRALLEAAIDALPEDYRSVFMMREIEGMTTAETAQCLEITEDTVKVRLHRARRMIREDLYARAGAASSASFQFLGARCDNLVKSVMQRILSAG